MKKIDICIKQEALNYFADDVVFEYQRFLDKQGIDKNDINNKYVAAMNRALVIAKEETYGNDDYDALLKIENELDDLRKMIR